MKIPRFKEFVKAYYDGTEGVFCIPQKFHGITKKSDVWFQNKKSFASVNDDFERFENKSTSLNHSTYFSINTFIDNSSRKEENLKNLNGLFFDIDVGGRPIALTIYKNLEKFGILPFAVLKSSNFGSDILDKFQIVYKFDKPFEASPEILKRVGFITEATTSIFKTDRTFDLARVGRMPQTINGKRDVNDFTELVFFDKNLCQFEDFEKFVSSVGYTPEVKTKAKSKTINKNKLNPFEYPFFELTEKLALEMREYYKKILESYSKKALESYSKKKFTRSEADFAMCVYLIRSRKFGDELVKSILFEVSERHDVLNDTVRMIRKIRSEIREEKNGS